MATAAMVLLYQSSEIPVTLMAGLNTLLGSNIVLTMTLLSLHFAFCYTLLEAPSDNIHIADEDKTDHGNVPKLTAKTSAAETNRFHRSLSPREANISSTVLNPSVLVMVLLCNLWKETDITETLTWMLLHTFVDAINSYHPFRILMLIWRCGKHSWTNLRMIQQMSVTPKSCRCQPPLDHCPKKHSQSSWQV